MLLESGTRDPKDVHEELQSPGNRAPLFSSQKKMFCLIISFFFFVKKMVLFKVFFHRFEKKWFCLLTSSVVKRS